MSSFQSIELYDPESPSLDDELGRELTRASSYKGSKSVSHPCSLELSVNVSSETRHAENQNVSATDGTTTHDKQEHLSDVAPADEHVKPVTISKPAVIWRSMKKVLGPTLKEFDDTETVKDNVVKKTSLSVTPPDSNMCLPDLDEAQQLENSEQLQLQQQCCSSNANDRLNSAECDALLTVSALSMSSVAEALEKVHESIENREDTDIERDDKKFTNGSLEKTDASDKDNMLNDSFANSIVDIAEPTEPDDDDQMMPLSEQPRIIKLSRTEDPSEPDELLQTSDTNCNNESQTLPRIIRLVRESESESSRPTALLCDISDPSEPTDTDYESPDDEVHGFVPREIKLDRVELSSSSPLKPRVIQLNTLLAKRHTGDSYTSLIAKTYPSVDSSEGRTVNNTVSCRDVPLSPTDSFKSTSDNDQDGRHSLEPSVPRFIVLEDCNYNIVSDIENSRSLSRGSSCSVKSDHSILNHRYLSEGEIVDEEEEEEFGIFQLPRFTTTRYDKTEKQNSKQYREKSDKKRSYEDVDDDVGLKVHTKSADGTDHSRNNEWQKVSKTARTSVSSRSSSDSEHYSESTDGPKQHLSRVDSKETSTLPLGREQKRRKQKAKQASMSPERLLVRTNHTSKRKVVVVSKPGESKKGKRYRQLTPITITHQITPTSFEETPHERTQKRDMLESERRKLKKRKHTVKRHHKRRTRRNELRVHKHKWKHRKHKHRKHRSDADNGFVGQRHNHGRSRSYDRIVETIRSEEHQSSNMRPLRSVVVHRNTLVSARQRSSSISSCDSHHSVDGFAPSAVSPNLERRGRNVSDGHMHLSRLSYSGDIEQDVRNTLLGECIKSKYGPEYDVNCISRNFAYLCSSPTAANDDVEILGVSYSREKQSRNNNLHNADGSGVASGYERRDVATSSEQQPRPPVEVLTSSTVEEPVTTKQPPRNDASTNKTESKKVTVSSKEVQTQESLFAETTECNVLSDNTKDMPSRGKADKELQVSNFDNDEECIRSPSSPAAVACNTVLSEVVSGIQSPEHRTEESSHVPRPVLLDRADAPQPTTDSLRQDFSDLYFTVRNFSKPLSVTRSLTLERLEEESAGDNLPPVTSGTGMTLKSTTEQLKHGATAGSTEVSSKLTAGDPAAADTPDFNAKNRPTDADIKQLPVRGVARSKEQSHLSSIITSVTAPAVHQLPPIVQPYKCAAPLRRVNPFSDKLTMSSTVLGSAGHVPVTSATQQLQNKLLSGDFSNTQSAAAMIGGVSSSVPSQLQRGSQNSRCSPDLPESRSFFGSVKSDRIPGICEDVEPDTSHSEPKTGRSISLSSYQSSLISSSFPQTSGSLGVINVVVSSAAATSETPQQTVPPTDTVTSHMQTSSYVTSHLLPLSSSQGNSASVTYSTVQRTVAPTFAVNSGSSLVKQPVVAGLLPLLSTLATCLLKTPLKQQNMTVAVSSATTNSVTPAVSSRHSLPVLNYASTTITSTDDAVSAWITSLPQSTTAVDPQPDIQPLPKPCVELDFDVDAVESPRSDEIMSFSPPSSEHMMSVIKMKHTVGLRDKATRKTTNGLKKQTETKMTARDKEEMMKRISCQFKLIMHPYYRSGKITKDEYKDIMRKAVPAIFHSRSRDTSNLKMVRYAGSYVHKVLMMRKYLAKKNALVSQSSS